MSVNEDETIKKNGQEEKENSGDVENLGSGDLEQLESQMQNEKEKFLRIIANYENKMKRIKIDSENYTTSIITNLVEDLVAILDDLNNAHKIAPMETKEGLVLIIKNTKKLLNKYGIEEIVPQIGEFFNSNQHQAVATKACEIEEGKIVEVLKSGYKFKEKTISPAIVVIAK